jgi:6-methylsalicylate decarboxylase
MSTNGSRGILSGAIDLHAHYLPHSYVAELDRRAITRPDDFRTPGWSVDGALELMHQLGVATMVLSLSSPGVYFGDRAAAVELAHSCNGEGAAIVAAHPERFGLLASLPLPDVDAACAEAVWALDELGADGIALQTHAGDQYVGDPALEPLMDELDRRSALVVLHPTSPHFWTAPLRGQPAPMLEFPFDTTRAVVNLVTSGTLERHPNISVVVPHTGAALAVLGDRVPLVASITSGAQPADVIGQLQRLYYDVAGAPLPRALRALLTLVTPLQLVYGSDAPHTPANIVTGWAHRLACAEVLDEPARQAMIRGNAIALLPRLLTAAMTG